MLCKRQLEQLISTQFSIKDDFYSMKYINDILFNHSLLSTSMTREEVGPEGEEVPHRCYGKNIQKYTGKMLTAVFKDYLIYDDVYEFLDGVYLSGDCVQAINQYAKNMNQIATLKYGYKLDNYTVNHENIVNRPSYIQLNKLHYKTMNNNLKLKYLIKYEKRVYQRQQ